MKSQPTSTCLAESEDSLLPLDGLDLKPLDSATTNPTHKPSSKNIGRMCQSTETSKHSMARHIEESLFSQEDFPASRSVVPGSNEARTMTAISGRKCSESYKRQGQLGLLVRMLLESSAWHSTKCVLTWRRVDTKSSRSLFQLAVSMPRTEETEYGLLRRGGAMWPTPQAHDAKHIYSKMKPTGQQMLSNHIYKIDSTTIGGKLNPAFVEWLMGYQTEHTALKDWAMPSSRKSHTKSSKA